MYTWQARNDPCSFSYYKTSLSPITVTGLMARIKLFVFISPDPLICEVKSSKYIRICQGSDQVSEVSAAQAIVVILGKQERIPLRTYDRNRFCAQGFSGTLTLQANNYSLSLVERRPLPVPAGTLSHSGQQLTQASASK